MVRLKVKSVIGSPKWSGTFQFQDGAVKRLVKTVAAPFFTEGSCLWEVCGIGADCCGITAAPFNTAGITSPPLGVGGLVVALMETGKTISASLIASTTIEKRL